MYTAHVQQTISIEFPGEDQNPREIEYGLRVPFTSQFWNLTTVVKYEYCCSFFVGFFKHNGKYKQVPAFLKDLLVHGIGLYVDKRFVKRGLFAVKCPANPKRLQINLF